MMNYEQHGDVALLHFPPSPGTCGFKQPGRGENLEVCVDPMARVLAGAPMKILATFFVPKTGRVFMLAGTKPKR